MKETAVQWVSVRDAVPDTARVVLVAWNDGRTAGVARRRIHDGAWFLVVDGKMAEVTHWAEMPSPPEE